MGSRIGPTLIRAEEIYDRGSFATACPVHGNPERGFITLVYTCVDVTSVPPFIATRFDE